MLPPVASVLLFKYFYDPGYGLFNRILGIFHLPEQQWLQDTSTSMLSVVIAATWMNMGGATLIYLAALQGIPRRAVRGRGTRRRGTAAQDLARHHPADPPHPLAPAADADHRDDAGLHRAVPAHQRRRSRGSTTTVVYLIYQYAFNFNNYGSAAALGLVLLVVLAGFSAVYVRLSRSSED